MVATLSAADGTVRVWPVLWRACRPLHAGRLRGSLAGRRLREDGVPESVPVERWKTLSGSLGSLVCEDFYALWARWFIT